MSIGTLTAIFLYCPARLAGRNAKIYAMRVLAVINLNSVNLGQKNTLQCLEGILQEANHSTLYLNGSLNEPGFLNTLTERLDLI